MACDPTVSNGDPCSLPGDQREDRVKLIRRELLPHVKRREALPNGIAWEFERTPELLGKLERFVEFERQCCSGLEFGLEAGSDRLRLTVEGTDAAAFEALGRDG